MRLLPVTAFLEGTRKKETMNKKNASEINAIA
jgi:hypothetical protein